MSQIEKMKVNPDLAMERAKCNFNIMEVTHILDGGEENTLRRKQIGKSIFFYNIIRQTSIRIT